METSLLDKIESQRNTLQEAISAERGLWNDYTKQATALRNVVLNESAKLAMLISIAKGGAE